MRAGALLVCALLAMLSLVELPAETARMPLDEVERGMRGVGVTVFQGVDREEFDVVVLGVLRNVMGPQRNLIVARLEGDPLADTGVIQGRSRASVQGAASADELFDRIGELTQRFSDSGAVACGVGTGGPMTAGGVTVSPLTIQVWREFPLLERLSSQTGLPTYIDNDAKALALA